MYCLLDAEANLALAVDSRNAILSINSIQQTLQGFRFPTGWRVRIKGASDCSSWCSLFSDLWQAKTLHFLDVSQNSLDKKSVEYIVAALTPAPESGLLTLRMDDCQLRPAALETLCERQEHPFPFSSTDERFRQGRPDVIPTAYIVKI